MPFDNPSPRVSHEGDCYALRVSHDPGTCVIEAYGVLDAHASGLMGSLIEEGESTSVDRILVDLSGVDFIASAGMKVLADADARSRANGHQLALLRAPDPVQRLLEQVGLAAHLPFQG